MAYIGNDLRSNEDYKIIDDISSGFNGSATSFALQVGGATPVPFPKFEQQLLISVNGVIQEPDPTGSAGFKLSGTNIVFSSAPTNGHAFFGVIYAGADYVNAGGTFPDGSINFPSITFSADTNTGFTRTASGTVALISDGTKVAQFPTSQGSSGQALITDGGGNLSFGVPTAAFTDITLADSIIHSGDTNTKIKFPTTDTISFETNGGERARITSGGRLGIGDTAPDTALHVKSADNILATFESTDADALIEFKDNSTSDTMIIGCEGGDNLLLRTDAGNIIFNLGNNSEKARFDSSGRLLLGKNATKASDGENTAKAQIESTGNCMLDIAANGTTSSSYAALNLIRSDGSSVNAHTAVDSGDRIARINFIGADGSDRFNSCARIAAFAAADFTANNCPGHLVFETNPGAAAASERMRITSAGNIGIGTSSPAALLTLNKAIPEVRLNSSNNNFGMGDELGRISLHTSDGSTPGTGEVFRIKTESSSSIGADYTTRLYNRNGSGGGATEISLGNGQGSIYLSTNTTGNTTASARMAVMSDGDVGIGTTSPSARLHVSGGDGLLVERSSGTSIAGFKHSGASAMNVYFQNTGSSNHPSIGSSNQDLTIGTNNNERVRIASAGTIGIGHSTPRGQVMINSDKNALVNANCNDPHHFHINLKNDNDTNGEAIGIAFSASSTIDRVGAAIIHKRLGAGSVGELRFYTCTTEGTTKIAGNLTKNQEFRLGGIDENNSVAISTDPCNSIGTPGLHLNTNNLARVVIQERTANWISFKDGSGTHYGTIARSGSGVSYGSNSDYRLKDNVADLTGGITLLKQLRPVTFNWNDLSGLSKTETHQGFIAHEVQALVPDAVEGEKDGMDIWGDCKDSEGNITQEHVPESKKKEGETWTKTGEGILDQQLDTSKLIPILTQALKEAITEIETLKTKVAALETA